MGRLIYLLNVSLDRFVETADHSTAWTTVDDELFTWFTDRTRELDASIYGRRLYETMAGYWPRGEADPAGTNLTREYARVWNAMPKAVFSTTLTSVAWNSRLVQGDVAEELARLRLEFAGDIGVGGPTLAAEFIRRGLVDEYWLVVHPVVIGAGTPYFPPLDRPIPLRLLETQTFRSGAVFLRYGTVR